MSNLTLTEFLVIEAMLGDNPDARVDEREFAEIMRNIKKKSVCERCGGSGSLTDWARGADGKRKNEFDMVRIPCPKCQPKEEGK